MAITPQQANAQGLAWVDEHHPMHAPTHLIGRRVWPYQNMA